MNNQFDELTKNMAQSVTRRQAFKRFGLGLAGMALACFGLAHEAKAGGEACRTCLKICRSYGGTQQSCKQECSFACKGWDGP